MLPHLVQFGFVAAGGAVVAIGLSRKSALDAAVLAQHETLAPEKETT
jgi:hypothetical protein